MTLKITTIVGARPQFIKAAAVSRVIRDNYADEIIETIVHTGQHYDKNMSETFFRDLEIPSPKYNLKISASTHGKMTGRMVEDIEKVLLEEPTDAVLIYGDTNSTLAGGIAASKLHIPVVHVEAGLRSYNRRMPEELNRILSDHISTLLFCPTPIAVENLRREGIDHGVYEVGDVMYDIALFYRDSARKKSNVLSTLGLEGRRFILATCHRAENTDDPTRLRQILEGLSILARNIPVILPLHPRTRAVITKAGLEKLTASLTTLPPLPFLDMLLLEQMAEAIITDSGGVQKEAFFFDVPCITTREETEWTETVECGWNTLVGADANKIVSVFENLKKNIPKPELYGGGDAASQIVEVLKDYLIKTQSLPG
jgi:UDP-GlcNAc3NAcA epimerase